MRRIPSPGPLDVSEMSLTYERAANLRDRWLALDEDEAVEAIADLLSERDRRGVTTSGERDYRRRWFRCAQQLEKAEAEVETLRMRIDDHKKLRAEVENERDVADFINVALDQREGVMSVTVTEDGTAFTWRCPRCGCLY